METDSKTSPKVSLKETSRETTRQKNTMFSRTCRTLSFEKILKKTGCEFWSHEIHSSHCHHHLSVHTVTRVLAGAYSKIWEVQFAYYCCNPNNDPICMCIWIIFRHVKDFICQRAQHTDGCFIRFPEMLPNSTEISEHFSLSNGSGGGPASYEARTHASRSRERAVRESQKGQMVGQEDPGSTNLYPFEDFKLFFCKSSGGNISVEGANSKFSPSIVRMGWRFCTREAVRFWMWNEDKRPFVNTSLYIL